MNRKLLWIIVACFAAGIITSFICYEITKSTTAGIVGAVFIVGLLLFEFIASTFESIKKKNWIAVLVIILCMIIACTLIFFIAKSFVLIQDKQKAIDEILVLIEQQVDIDEKFRLTTEFMWPLIDERFALYQRVRLLTIGLNFIILSVHITETIIEKLKKHKAAKKPTAFI